MSTRRLLAAGSAFLIALRLLAGPGGTADRLLRAGEAGLAEAARDHDAAQTNADTPAPTAETIPTAEPEPTPEPTADAAPAETAPTTAPDGRAILAATLTGGMLGGASRDSTGLGALEEGLISS